MAGKPKFDPNKPFVSADEVTEPGNIDLTKRPRVKNADGSISTVRSMGVNIDGKEVLIPTVSDDGRIMADQEAIDTYKKTGRHLGKFASPEASTKYAESLHDDQAEMIKKPKFDPNQPFEPAEEKSPGMIDRFKALFSPEVKQQAADIQNKRGAEIDRQNKAGTGLLQTELEQTGNALTFGYLPQIEAGVGKMFGGDYLANRDANVARLERQAEDHPVPAAAGAVAGTLIGAKALPLGALAKGGGGVVKGALKGAALGGIQGAVQNPGDVEGEINPLQGDERFENAKSGAALGGKIGAAAGVGQSLAKGAQKLGAKFKGGAESVAFKSSGAMLKDFRQAAGKDEVGKLGRFMLDEKMAQAGDTYESVAQKAQKVNKEAGGKLNSIYKKAVSEFKEPYIAKNMPGLNPVKDKAEILKLVQNEMGDAVDGPNAVKKLSAYLDDLGAKYGDTTLDPRIQNDIKGAIDDTINYSRNPLNKQPDTEKAFGAARKYVADKIDSSVEFIGKKSGNPKLANELREANKRYGMSKRIEGIAKDRVNRTSANNAFGISDRMAGGAAGILGGAASVAGGERDPSDVLLNGVGLGLMGMAGNAALGRYGTSTLSKGLDRGGGLLRSAGQAGEALMPSPGLAARVGVSGKKKKRGLIESPDGLLIPVSGETP